MLDLSSLKAKWDADAALREEFFSFEGYVAYERALANGWVPIAQGDSAGNKA